MRQAVFTAPRAPGPGGYRYLSILCTAVFTTPSSWARGDRWLFLFVLCIMTRTSRSHFFFPYKDKIFWDLALLLSVPFSICPLGFLSEALQYNLILWNFLRSTWRFQGKCTVGKKIFSLLKMFYAFLYPTCNIFTDWLPFKVLLNPWLEKS